MESISFETDLNSDEFDKNVNESNGRSFNENDFESQIECSSREDVDNGYGMFLKLRDRSVSVSIVDTETSKLHLMLKTN